MDRSAAKEWIVVLADALDLKSMIAITPTHERGRPRGASENNLERESWSGSKLDVRPDDEIPWPRSDDHQPWYAIL